MWITTRASIALALCLFLFAAPLRPARPVTPSADTSCENSIGPYDPALAQMLSLSFTFGGMALGGAFFFAAGTAGSNAQPGLIAAGSAFAGAALLVGPAVGHFYAKNVGWPVGRILMRTVLAGTGTLGFVTWFGDAMCSEYCDEPNRWGVPLWIASSIGFVTLLVIDFATVKPSARRANERHKGLQVTLAPTVFATGGHIGGLALVGLF